MKSTQVKNNKLLIGSDQNLLKKSLISGIIGFLSWSFIFIFFFPLAGYYKFRETYNLELLVLLQNPNFYIKSLFVGFIFFLFFYLTLKYKEQSQLAKITMWLGIIGYTLFYLGYLFLLFFFRFTDL